MPDTDFRLGRSPLARGERSTIRLPTGIRLHDGAELAIDAAVIRGPAAGPVVFVGSGVHGDEAGAVAISSRLISETDPGQLRGTLVIVPVQNPLAFWSQHRLPLPLLLHSPLDHGNANVFQSYPGDPDGNTTERLTHFLFSELMTRADVVIDLHTPTTGGSYLPFAFVPPASLGEPAVVARALARAFGVRAILGFDGSRYTSPLTPHVAAAKRGVAAFGVELGEGGRVDPAQVSAGAEGLRNMLRHLEMLQESASLNELPVELSQLVPVRARGAGFLTVHQPLGAVVEQGDPVAEITGVHGGPPETLVSPVSGLLMRMSTFPIICSGEQVAQLGVVG